MNSAMGMVAPTVKMPHGLSASALTTTSASTASRITRMARIASTAMKPAGAFNSSFTIWPSDLPSRRIEQNKMTKSCTAPPSTTPMRIHSVAGQVTELRRQHRPDQRSRPGNGREMMAEDDPFVRLDEIPAVVVDHARRGAAVVERQHARGNPFGVKPVADGVGADRGDENIGGIDRLAPAKRQRGIRARAGQGEQEPEK